VLAGAGLLRPMGAGRLFPSIRNLWTERRFANLNLGGPTDTTKNAFFQDIGTNGRRCVTCHQATTLTVTPPHILARFEATNGTIDFSNE